MIAVNEIRIGNWLQDRHEVTEESGFYVQVESIMYKGINYSYRDEEDEYLFEHLHPIPLTPEILEKCGFVYDNSHKINIGNGVTLEFDSDVFFKQINSEGVPSFVVMPIEIKYLHQLQNLIFALTGKELKVKL